MIVLLQRVLNANITVDSKKIAAIGKGILCFIGMEKTDNQVNIDKVIQKILKIRIFEDEQNKMNQSLLSVNGDLLLVPQFTLVADTTSGLRPSFAKAKAPSSARELFEYFVVQAGCAYHKVQSGKFGADMEVELVNYGPATFLLQTDHKE